MTAVGSPAVVIAILMAAAAHTIRIPLAISSANGFFRFVSFQWNTSCWGSTEVKERRKKKRDYADVFDLFTFMHVQKKECSQEQNSREKLLLQIITSCFAYIFRIIRFFFR